MEYPHPGRLCSQFKRGRTLPKMTWKDLQDRLSETRTRYRTALNLWCWGEGREVLGVEAQVDTGVCLHMHTYLRKETSTVGHSWLEIGEF